MVKKLVVSESNRKSDGIQHHFRPAVAGDRARLRQFADSDMPLHRSSSTTLPWKRSTIYQTLVSVMVTYAVEFRLCRFW